MRKEYKKIIAFGFFGALFVSFLYGIPNLIIKKRVESAGKSYRAITLFSDWDEAVVYAPIGRESGEKFKLTDPSLAEHIDTPYILPPSGPFLLGIMANLFGIDRGLLLLDFVLPPIIFLLFFGICHLITKKSLISFLLSIIFILTPRMATLLPFSSKWAITQFLLYFKPYISQVVNTRLPFDRIFSPEWTFIPLAAFFLFLIAGIEKNKKIFWFLAGLSYGVMFYTYFYDWVSISAILGIFFLAALLRKDISTVKKITMVIATGLFVSLFYWFNFFAVTRLPQYADIADRTGLQVGRIFLWSYLPQYILWGVCAIWLYGKKHNGVLNYLATAIFLGAIVLLNIQIITGYVPLPGHFITYPLAMALFIAFIVLGVELWREYNDKIIKFKRYLYFVLMFGIMLIAVRSVLAVASYIDNNAFRYEVENNINLSYEWMSDNLKEDAVVLTPSFYSTTHLMIFTPAKVFYPPTGLLTSASNREIIERYIIVSKLFGVSDERLKELFGYDYINFVYGHRSDLDIKAMENNMADMLLHNGLHSQVWNDAKIFRDLSDLEKMVSDILSEWQNNRDRLVDKYDFNYVYVGPYEKNMFNFQEEKFPVCLETVYDYFDVKIFRVCQFQD